MVNLSVPSLSPGLHTPHRSEFRAICLWEQWVQVTWEHVREPLCPEWQGCWGWKGFLKVGLLTLTFPRGTGWFNHDGRKLGVGWGTGEFQMEQEQHFPAHGVPSLPSSELLALKSKGKTGA